jgi:hypothetical protein
MQQCTRCRWSHPVPATGPNATETRSAAGTIKLHRCDSPCKRRCACKSSCCHAHVTIHRCRRSHPVPATGPNATETRSAADTIKLHRCDSPCKRRCACKSSCCHAHVTIHHCRRSHPVPATGPNATETRSAAGTIKLHRCDSLCKRRCACKSSCCHAHVTIHRCRRSHPVPATGPNATETRSAAGTIKLHRCDSPCKRRCAFQASCCNAHVTIKRHPCPFQYLQQAQMPLRNVVQLTQSSCTGGDLPCKRHCTFSTLCCDAQLTIDHFAFNASCDSAHVSILRCPGPFQYLQHAQMPLRTLCSWHNQVEPVVLTL